MMLDFLAEVEHVNGVKIIDPSPTEGMWYRYDDTPGYDWQHPLIALRQFAVKRETSKCVVLDDYGVDRFVLKGARKRFAYPTIALARDSFLHRKRHQVGHLSRQHDHAAAVLATAEKHFK